jgi:hypothetical protein
LAGAAEGESRTAPVTRVDTLRKPLESAASLNQREVTVVDQAGSNAHVQEHQDVVQL